MFQFRSEGQKQKLVSQLEHSQVESMNSPFISLLNSSLAFSWMRPTQIRKSNLLSSIYQN